ncbi:histone-lysine N-methyltransferase SETMAR [Trichonephila inaurata madagascariensis]|uniref:Histone-lysine N-methyltransferase SETMAR n=1 Tax=Trichonephila inaurata madagascariensis TaxID=2747483 RepID=A0A8X6YMY9_9ARAC|nr:histone-lysine N-methyltransferase SETMAR [Trichonephila inaurata madagascariensis]
MSKQMVRRWCRTFSDGRQQVEDIPRAGRTRTATTDANVGKVDDMIRANRRITIDEVEEELGISHERAQNIIHDILRYRKVSARWVPRQLTSTHQEQRMAVSLEHLVGIVQSSVEFNTLKSIASPVDSLPKAYFHTELFVYTDKSTQHPEYLRQTALEMIDGIPEGAILSYRL